MGTAIMPLATPLAPRAPSTATLSVLSNALRDLRISQPGPAAAASAFQARNASHQAQGRANKAKQGPGKRLGAKKTAGQYVVPGNILFKQRRPNRVRESVWEPRKQPVNM